MKKTLSIVLLLLAVGVAIWYVSRGGNAQPSTDQPLNEQAVSLVSSGDVSVVSPVDSKKVALEAKALEIISHPVMVKIPILESSKKSALAKIEEVADLIRDNYDYANAWYDLGAYRMVIGDYDGAIEAYEFVISIRPADHVGYANLGDIYGFYLKNYPLAEENFLKAIRNNPAYIFGYAELAVLYEGNFSGGVKKAEDILLAGLKVNPQDAYLSARLDGLRERAVANQAP